MKAPSPDRSWFLDAVEEVSVEIKTERALARVVDRMADETRARINAQKVAMRKIRSKPVTLGPMKSVAYWAEILGFDETTIYDWCKQGLLNGVRVRGRWRISEAAVTEFLSQQKKGYGRSR